MAQLLSVQLESCHHNLDGSSFYAYFKGEPTKEELETCLNDPALIEASGLSPDKDEEFPVSPEEVPNLLSKAAGLRRYYVSEAA